MTDPIPPQGDLTPRPTATVTIMFLCADSDTPAVFETNIVPTTNPVDAMAAALDLAGLLKPLSLGELVGVSITRGAINLLPAAPNPLSVGGRKLQLYAISANGKPVTFSIPAGNPEALRGDGSVDEDNAEVVALVNRLKATPFVDSNNVPIIGLRGGRRLDLRTTKRRLPRVRRDPDTTAETAITTTP